MIFNLKVNKRQFVLLLMIVFIPYSTISLFGNPYLFLPMVFFIIYLVLSFNFRKSVFDTKGTKHFFIAWIAIWFLSLLSTIANYVPEYGSLYRSFLQRLVIYFVLFWVTFNEIRKSRRLTTLIKHAVALSVLLMFLFYVTGIGVEYVGFRLTLFGSNANTIGVWAVFAILMALDIIFENPRNRKFLLVYLFVIIFAFLLMVMSGSRKAVIMLAAGVFAYYLFMNKGTMFKLKLLIPFALASVLAYNYLFSNELFLSRYTNAIEKQDLGGRQPIWENALDLISQYPLIGAGQGVYAEATESEFGKVRVPHNEFILIALNAAIPGLLFFLYFLLYLFYRSLRILKFSQFSTLPLSLTVALVIYLFTAGGGLTSFLGWFMFAFIAGTTDKFNLNYKKLKYYKKLQSNRNV